MVPLKVWLRMCHGLLHVLHTMWMGCPYQTCSLQWWPQVTGVCMAGYDSGIGLSWQQRKQNGARPAVMGAHPEWNAKTSTADKCYNSSRIHTLGFSRRQTQTQTDRCRHRHRNTEYTQTCRQHIGRPRERTRESNPGFVDIRLGSPPTGPPTPRISRGARRADSTIKTGPLVCGVFVCVCVCVCVCVRRTVSLYLSLSLSLSFSSCV